MKSIACAALILFGCSSSPATSSAPATDAGADDAQASAALDSAPPPVADSACATSEFYIDGDGDGFGDPTPVVLCARPANAVDNHTDCDDSDARAHPGQALFFTTPMTGHEVDGGAGSFDFDCNGTSEPQYGTPICSWDGLACTGSSGFDAILVNGVLEGEPPACGGPGLFATCAQESLSGSTCLVGTTSGLPTKMQACR